jgi:hypothetical protein
MAEENYHEQIARMRQERAAREYQETLVNIREQHADAIRERDEAAAAGDAETFEQADATAEMLEKDWNYLNPPQPPQMDPRLREFAAKNQNFLTRYGQRAEQALGAAHQYMLRPKNPNTNDPRYTGMGWNPQRVFTPAYFDNLKTLLEVHGETLFGVKYDPGEENLTANDAVKVTGAGSPERYNNWSRRAAAAGKFRKYG